MTRKRSKEELKAIHAKYSKHGYSKEDANRILKGQDDLEDKLKRRFASYSNQKLIDRCNRDYKNGKNTDDIEYELSRRRREGKINYKAGYDELVLVK